MYKRQELRLVDSKIIPEEKRNKNLNLARPLTLNDFIGQEQLKSSLRIAIDASIFRKEPMEHTLLYGQPGLGKTTLAILKEDLSCSWPINFWKLRGRAKLRLFFLFSSGMIFESTNLSSMKCIQTVR